MRNWLAVMALFLLVFMVSSGAIAGGLFGMEIGRTRETRKADSAVQVYMNVFRDGALQDLSTMDEPKYEEICDGDVIETLYTASVESIIDPKLAAERGVSIEWYKPGKDPWAIPFNYTARITGKKAREIIDESNRERRLFPRRDGDPIISVEKTEHDYVVGFNRDIVWMRVVNGMKIRKESHWVLIHTGDVAYSDVWIPVGVTYIVKPAKSEKADSHGKHGKDSGSSTVVTERVNNLLEIIESLKGRDEYLLQAYLAGQKVQDARFRAIEQCLTDIKGALGDLTVRDEELLKLIIANTKRDDVQDARLDRLEQAWETYRGSSGSVSTAMAVNFQIAFRCVRTRQLVAVNMDCSGTVVGLRSGIADYRNCGIGEGNNLSFRVARPGGTWQRESITVTRAMEGTTIEINVQ